MKELYILWTGRTLNCNSCLRKRAPRRHHSYDKGSAGGEPITVYGPYPEQNTVRTPRYRHSLQQRSALDAGGPFDI